MMTAHSVHSTYLIHGPLPNFVFFIIFRHSDDLERQERTSNSPEQRYKIQEIHNPNQIFGHGR